MAADPRYNSWNYGCWSYLSRSRYAEQVERWLSQFPREQMLFLKAEDLFAMPEETLVDVHRFLDLPAHATQQQPRLNTGEYDAVPSAVRQQLTAYFRPLNERLYELVGTDFGWEREAAAVSA